MGNYLGEVAFDPTLGVLVPGTVRVLYPHCFLVQVLAESAQVQLRQSRPHRAFLTFEGVFDLGLRIWGLLLDSTLPLPLENGSSVERPLLL